MAVIEIADTSRVFNQILTGAKPGTVFTAPATFQDGTELVYVNGQRQKPGLCYTTQESGGLGTGYDQIAFTFTILGIDEILIDYTPE